MHNYIDSVLCILLEQHGIGIAFVEVSVDLKRWPWL